MIKVRVIKRGTGSRYERYNQYEMRTPTPPDSDEIRAAQDEAGFSPLGYGEPLGIQAREAPSGEWVTTWFSEASAD